MQWKIAPEVYSERQTSFNGKKRLNKVSLNSRSVLKQEVLVLPCFMKAKQIVHMPRGIDCLPISKTMSRQRIISSFESEPLQRQKTIPHNFKLFRSGFLWISSKPMPPFDQKRFGHSSEVNFAFYSRAFLRS